MIDRDYLRDQAANYGITLEPDVLQKLDVYAELLVDWNQRMNLTAITEPQEIVIKHFLDSLLLTAVTEIPQNGSLVDVGTGAGFPGVPVKILRPDLELTLLDSLNKRLIFLEALCDQLGISAQRVHARAEEAGRGALRERFDLATARAVAPLSQLCEYCLPLVRVGGRFVALKGPDVEQEARQSEKAIALLGGKLLEIRRLELPDGSSRSFVMIEKISQTPPKYPRQSAKIAKQPL